MKLKFFSVIRDVIREPTKFFTKAAKEKTFANAFLFYLVFLAILNAFMLPYMLVALKPLLAMFGVQQLTVLVGIGYYLFAVISGSIGVFIRTGINWVLLWLFKGKGNYIQTFNGLVYAYAPLLLFAPLYLLMPIALVPGREWFMIVFVLLFLPAIIWLVWLQCTAMSIVHKISKGYAFVALFVVPMVVVLLLAFAFVMFLFLGLLVSSRAA